MTPERWHQVNDLFTAVVELDPEQRADFLDGSCADDADLRSEVESLLASDGRRWNMIEKSALEIVAPLLANEQPQLTAGQLFSHYKIINLIGKGGMGEVYLVLDQKLDRRIALKLLPGDYTGNQDRLRRFEQEAQAASTLNHPNILTIHEIGQVKDQRFIATEFVEGETLRERLKHRQLTSSEALEITTQVAGALLAAHQAGIVHRDIKPENIMVRPDGYVKVLDFGLAKLTGQHEQISEAQAFDDLNMSSGLVMGTVKYMSPEQARGMNVDSRSDIFSLGVVLYEMLTGRTPFEGQTTKQLMAAILNDELPSLTNTREDIQRLISKALRKNKEERYQTIQEVLTDLKAAQEDKAGPNQASTAVQRVGNLETSTIETAAIRSENRGRKIIVAFAFVSLVVAGVIFGLSQLARTRSVAKQMRITRVPNTDKAEAIAISPDGKYLAQIASQSGQYGIWLVDPVTGNNTPVITVASGTALTNLSFSKDGSRIYYVNNNALYKVLLQGGEPTKVIADVDGPLTVSPDETQVAFIKTVGSEQTSLIILNVNGAAQRVLATKKIPEFIDLPAWSPDGKLIACTSGRLASNRAERLIAFDVATGDEKLITGESWQAFVSLTWLPDNTGLIAAATETGEGSPQSCQIWNISYPAGEVRRITHDLDNYGGLLDRYGGLALTADGMSLVTVQWAQRSSVWVMATLDPTGAKPITSNDRYVYRVVSFTADGRILYPSDIKGNLDLWIMNSDGSDSKQLTANTGVNIHSNASPDGRYIVFSSSRTNKGTFNIWRINTDGSNPIQLTYGSGETGPTCSPDGLWVVYSKGGPEVDQAQKTLWKVSIDGGEPIQLTDTSSFGPAVAPDGTLIACWYKRNDSSPWQLALIPFTGGPPIKLFDVSRSTLRSPRWTPDGQAVSYINTTSDGVSNIWNQPINDGPAKQVTQFTDEQIDGFDWSRNGQLVCSRLHTTQEVVLINNFR